MKKNLKILTIFAGCLLFRLMPLRAPNLEPLMASVMPLGRKYGAWAGFLFGFLSIVLYDLFTNFGSWTWIAGVSYGVVGAVSAFYFKKKKEASVFNFAIFAFIATIAFDLVTGVLFAPMWGQSMYSAFILQIPFTALHLAGNIGFALTISPILDRWLAREEFFALKRKIILAPEVKQGIKI